MFEIYGSEEDSHLNMWLNLKGHLFIKDGMQGILDKTAQHASPLGLEWWWEK